MKAYGIYKKGKLIEVKLHNDLIRNQHHVERCRLGWGKECEIRELELKETGTKVTFSPLEEGRKR